MERPATARLRAAIEIHGTLFARITATAVVVAVSLPAIAPALTTPYFATADGILHVYRLVGLEDAIRHGVLYPRIFPAFGYEYSMAVLNFYGPLPYYLALPLRLLGASFVEALRWALALGFVGSGLAAYALARRFVPAVPSLAGATAYVYFPYHLAEVYERGALAEHTAWVFLPLILRAMALGPGDRERAAGTGSITRSDVARGSIGGVLVAALIATHPLIALMFLPFAILFGWTLNSRLPTRLRLAYPLLVLAAGAALSALYWLPVVAEARWVSLSIFAESSQADVHYAYESHIADALQLIQFTPLYDYTHTPGLPVFALTWPAALVLMLGIAAAVFAWRRERARARLLALFLSLGLAALVIQTNLALPIWRNVNVLAAYVQYPWRFMVLVALAVALTAALTLRGRALPALAGLLFVVNAVPGLELAAREPPRATFAGMWRDEFISRYIGTTWDREYLPRWVAIDPGDLPRPSERPVSDSAPAPATMAPIRAGYTRRSYLVNSPTSTTLRFHQFYLPAWNARLNGLPLETYPAGAMGLLSVTVPPTIDGLLELDYGPGLAEVLGTGLSGLAIAGLIWLHHRRRLAILVAGGFILWLLALQVSGLPAVVAQPVQARFEDFADLIGMSTDQTILQPGDTVQVTLYWLVRRSTTDNIRVFLHAEMNGIRLAQSDGDPVDLYTPTSRWQPGEVIEDTRSLTIPSNAGPGAVQLLAGMYRTNPLRNLAVTSARQAAPDGRVLVGEIRVEARR